MAPPPFECSMLHPWLPVGDLAGAIDFYVQQLGCFDVPVRLERRLAAVLAALAAEQGTTVSSLLEETLLHTFEGVGPHTPRTIARIAELKKAHGIDYDVHASYRFVE